MTIENCGNCAFGVLVYGHNSSVLRCHRRAPVVRSPTDAMEELFGPRAIWPAVESKFFCGEFELKDAT